MLAHANLARYAGQFVWLELNLDSPTNRAFFAKHAVRATPTFFVIDSGNDRVAAVQPGAMSLPELKQFLERARREVSVKTQTGADAALVRGDALLDHNQPARAATSYEDALRLSARDWPRRELAEASLADALQTSEQWQRCAETAATEASGMKRDSLFSRTVVAGMWCVVQGAPAQWTESQARPLERLAGEALSLPSTIRDHRNELYRTLMYLAVVRNDKEAAAKWGNQWLAELNAIQPKDDDERSAIDIARVENIQVYGDPSRILPALLASEAAMPHNYNASLRVAQMESASKSYEKAVAACDRGLARSPGAGGRSWLLQTKADALMQLGQAENARTALNEALAAAREIPNESMRQNNIAKVEKALAQPAKTQHH